MSHLRAYTRQGNKVIIVIRDLPSMFFMNNLSGLLYINCLLVVESDLGNPFIQISLFCLEDRLYRQILLSDEELRRSVCYFILCLS